MANQEERTAMRQRLRDWGGTAPAKLQQKRLEAQRQYEHAREDYTWARQQLKHAPADKHLRASLRRILADAKRAAQQMQQSYARELEHIEQLDADRKHMSELVNLLNGEQQELLYMRYCQHLSWIAVSRRVYLSISKARWHERIAVDKLVQFEKRQNKKGSVD